MVTIARHLFSGFFVTEDFSGERKTDPFEINLGRASFGQTSRHRRVALATGAFGLRDFFVSFAPRDHELPQHSINVLGARSKRWSRALISTHSNS
jgi:hypothetical protein